MAESLRVLKVARKTAISGCRIALQMIQTQTISVPEEVRDQLRNLTRMQLIRTLAASRPDMTGFRDPVTASLIALRSLARRYLDCTTRSLTWKSSCTPWSTSSAPTCSSSPAWATNQPPSCCSPPATTPASEFRIVVRDALRRRPDARLLRQTTATGSTAAVTVPPTPRCT